MSMRHWVGVLFALAHIACLADGKQERNALAATVESVASGHELIKLDQLFQQAGTPPLTVSGDSRLGVMLEGLNAVTGRVGGARFQEQAQSRADAFRKMFPASSAAVYMQAQLQLNLALQARGAGLAKDVTTTTWALFDAHVQKAADILRQAEGSVPQDEIWHVAVLNVASHQRLETAQVRRLVEAAADRFPESAPIYRAAARRLSAAGGGSDEDLSWLADLATRKSSMPASHIPYAQVYVGTDLHWNLFDATAVDWKRMRAGLQEQLHRYPDPWNVGRFALFACLARDAATLRPLLARLGQQFEMAGWDAAWRQHCIQLAQAPRTGGGSELFATREHFRSLLRDDDFDGIEQTHAQLVALRTPDNNGEWRSEQFFEYPSPRCRAALPAVATVGTPRERETQSATDARLAACYRRLEAKLAAWRQRAPESPLAAVALADLYLAQTDGRATPPSVLDATYEKSQAALLAVPSANRNLLWHRQRLWVGSLQGWGPARYRRALDEAMARYPDRGALYRQAVRHFLPGNGGSLAEVDQVARMGLALNGDARTGLLMYAYSYDELAFGGGNYHDSVYHDSPVQWPEMLAGLQEMRKRHPGVWSDNRTANHACLAGDMATLREMLARTRSSESPNNGWAGSWREPCIRRLEQQEKRENPPAKANT